MTIGNALIRRNEPLWDFLELDRSRFVEWKQTVEDHLYYTWMIGMEPPPAIRTFRLADELWVFLRELVLNP